MTSLIVTCVTMLGLGFTQEPSVGNDVPELVNSSLTLSNEADLPTSEQLVNDLRAVGATVKVVETGLRVQSYDRVADVIDVLLRFGEPIQSLDILRFGPKQRSQIPASKLAALRVRDLRLCAEISNEQALACARIEGLESIDLNTSTITDSGLRALVWTSPRIKRISAVAAKLITDAAFSPDGEAPQQSPTSLEELNLYGTKVGDSSVRVIASFPRLRVLRIGSTNATSAGLAALASATGLEELEFDHLAIDSELEQLLQLPKLRRLSLNNTSLTPGAIKALGLGSSEVEELYLAGAKGLADLAIAEGAFRGLKLLSINGSDFTKAALAGFKQCSKLKSLDISCSDLCDADIYALRECWRLEEFRAWRTPITIDGLIRMAPHWPLRRVYVGSIDASQSGRLMSAFPQLVRTAGSR